MAKETDHAHVIAPPLLLYLGFLLAGIATDYRAPFPGLGLSPVIRLSLGGVLLLIGATILLSAAGVFRKAGKKPAPWTPTHGIVESGPYKFTRNPMYLAMSLIYLGIAIACDSLIALALLLPLLVVIQFGVIAREERYLAGKFGDAYLQYKRRVRRWL